MTPFIIFFLFSLLNVILQTLKSILTIRGGKVIASFANAVAFGFYTVVIKQLTGFDIMTAVIITVLANLVGVYVSITLTEKMSKDKLWKITAVVDSDKDIEIMKIRLKYHDVGYTTEKLDNGKVKFDIYSYSQNDTSQVKEILTQSNCKHHYVPVNQL